MSRARLLVLSVALTSCWFTADCCAVTKIWTGGSGNWSPGNWSPAGIPAAGDPTRIVFTDGVARTVILNTNTPALGLMSIDLTGAGSAESSLSITSSNTLTAGGLLVGGHNGVTSTSGRGSVTQSAGTVSTSAGLDLVLADGAGSTGTYSLSGTGAVVASQSLYVGLRGTGVFNHSGGTNTINAGAIGSFDVGVFAGSSGTYNLSGTGQLISNKSEYVGDQGTGSFFQTGGTNTITGANSLFIGFSPTGQGTYAISGGQLTVGNNLVAGNNGVGVLTIGPNGNAHVTNSLTIGAQGTVNLNGGTLRLNGFTKQPSGVLNYSSGTVRFAGSRELRSNAAVTAFFPGGLVASGKKLVVEGAAFPEVFTIDGGDFQSLSTLNLGWNGDGETFVIQNGGTASTGGALLGVEFDRSGSATVTGAGSTWDTGELRVGQAWSGSLLVAHGATVTSTQGYVASSSSSGVGEATVIGAGSLWDVNGSLRIGTAAFGSLRIADQATVEVADNLILSSSGVIELDGGRLRFADYQPASGSVLRYNSGVVQVAGNRSLGPDTDLQAFFGTQTLIPAGKELHVEGVATLVTNVTLRGGSLTAGQLVGPGNLDFQQGTLRLTSQAVTVGAGGLFGPTLDIRAGQRIDIDLGVTNSGVVTGDGVLGGAYSNAPGGLLRAEPGSLLTLTGSATNDGSVQLLGGALDFRGGLVNNAAGTITGNGSLVASALTNHGAMNFAGTTNVVGNVTNSPTGKIVSGGGGATVFFDDVVNNGEVRTSTNGFTVFFGAVSGAGVFTGTGTVNFEGSMSPGNSPAAVSFAGDVTFGEGATLAIEIGGPVPGAQFDRLVVAGDLNLDGSLSVGFSGGFIPTAGQSFDLLDWESLGGAFSTLSLPALSGGLNWNTSQLYSTGVLSIAAAGLPGDYNEDGLVDAADYTVWRDGLGSAIALPNDDTPGVAADDYTRWVTNYGAATPSNSHSQSIPEPAAALLALLATMAIGRRRLA